MAAGIDDTGDRTVQAVCVGVCLGYQPAPKHQATVTQLGVGSDDLTAQGPVPVGEHDQVKWLSYAVAGLQDLEAGTIIVCQPVAALLAVGAALTLLLPRSQSAAEAAQRKRPK